ncbi:MAG: aldehyde dehydrogenase family protein [bacterium]|nr:aldehyde dehydrogenase family protein [bacterium]
MKIHIPALCFGPEYHSLTRHPVVDLGSGEELASLGLVLENRIAADCLQKGLLKAAFATLQSIPVRERIAMCVEAAAIFESGILDGGGELQTPGDYIKLLARTSGLSYVLARANTTRICAALRSTEAIMNGLSRGLPLDIYDTGLGQQGGATVRLNPRIEALGCCMPNNSPGVQVIWLVALAFGIPVLIRPGSSEPFTPYRLIQAFVKAGFPKEVFGYYPCDHDAANRIPELTRGAIVFGSNDTVKRWANHPLVQVHGSGFSKLIVGEDRIDDWESLIPEIAYNVWANSGRSCFAVSRIMVPRYGKVIAEAIAKEFGKIVPRPLDHPKALLSAMAMPSAAELVNSTIEAGLKQGGAFDVSASYREGNRLVKFEGRTYLQPTVIHCDSNTHPLANEEFLFPFTAVIEASNDQAFAQMGSTLALAVYTNDDKLKARARRSKVSLVSINTATSRLDRMQPHEENLFELLYHRLSYTEG